MNENEVSERLLRIEQKLDKLLRAFPDDPDSGLDGITWHAVHQSRVMKDEMDTSKLKSALIERGLTFGLWSMLGLIAAAVWFYFQFKVTGVVPK